ncbi:halocyanin [Halomicrobium sp. IBSBa]|uniref:plastocyanin/azurin family copper-binding protein n=1 Tax=Halomicrobium sp. IBSBa TaxID=2778916 RepID=UPI001ABEFC8F|nr:plastocyanin/azurin family copper-binding protein [Halomicrobium sp. IBSBa]MBO4248134.1 halocyanin [Halomicrobium sp. IBSBa]
MERRAYLRTVVGASAVGLSGCLGGLTESGDYDVGMTSNAFDPAEITVAAGDTVVWRNTSSHAHSVTAYEDAIPDGADYFASGGFDDEPSARDGWTNATDGSLYQGDTYSHTFEVAGRYRYFCIPHERGGMIGTVVVE